jgi:hypothetical protein
MGAHDDGCAHCEFRAREERPYASGSLLAAARLGPAIPSTRCAAAPFAPLLLPFPPPGRKRPRAPLLSLSGSTRSRPAISLATLAARVLSATDSDLTCGKCMWPSATLGWKSTCRVHGGE